jgi:hypothetical protein
MCAIADESDEVSDIVAGSVRLGLAWTGVRLNGDRAERLMRVIKTFYLRGMEIVLSHFGCSV